MWKGSENALGTVHVRCTEAMHNLNYLGVPGKV